MVGKHISKPSEAIAEAKKHKNMGKTAMYLIFVSVILALASAIAVFTKFTPIMTAGLAIGVFVMTLVASLILGWIVQIIVTTLGGKGKFFEGLTSVVNMLVVPSIGVLVSAIFIHVVPAGIIVIFLALLISLSIGLATFYRSIKEMFSTDMITAFVTVSIMTMAIVIAMLGAMFMLPKLLPMMSFGGMIA